MNSEADKQPSFIRKVKLYEPVLHTLFRYIFKYFIQNIV